ncbi:MAG: cation-transporting P-type ATPase [Spirochaetales bacterium]|nr:cation-transporting P-type ATPase [Spirochaetales bacterium]
MEENKNHITSYYNMDTPWSLHVRSVLQKLQTDPSKGLNRKAVASRTRLFGPNSMKTKQKTPAAAVFINQFKSIIMLILMTASLLAFMFTHWTDGVAIIIAIFLNAGIGFFMELKAVRTMERLQHLDKRKTTVLRGGKTVSVASVKVVPGDIVLVESGQGIPADMRLMESNNITVNESALTGESRPVLKTADTLQETTILADRKNMLYKGTSVEAGSGKAVVTGTGEETELGGIARMVEEAETEKDLLEERIRRLGQKLIWLILAIVGVSGVSGILMQRDMLLMIKLMIALAVAAVPEGLPIVESLALARGMQRMAKRQALVRRLSAVQTLGSVTTIFTDKTGTLTENRMTVTRIIVPGQTFFIKGDRFNGEDGNDVSAGRDFPSLLRRLLETAVLCNNAVLPDKEEPETGAVGDPTEIGLLEAGKKADIERPSLLEKSPEVREVAFDPELKMMATIHGSEEKFFTAVKGAPVAVLPACTRYSDVDGMHELTSELRKEWLDKNERFAAEGLRVLAAAGKESGGAFEAPYEGLVFYGLLCMIDPPREEIRSAVRQCRNAGIRVVMVTGDQEHTARYIAKTLELTDGDIKVMTGKELENEEGNGGFPSAGEISRTSVFARITPAQKLDIVSRFQKSGEIVAMTGDGVNDAPALKKADIGIAMGKRGKQSARDASDIILLDDSFNSIVYAVKYGRSVFNNIRMFVIYLISGNLGEIMLVTLASLLGLPIPLLPLQILYLNMINDVFPALALGLTGEDEKIMGVPPRDTNEAILTKRSWIHLLVFGFIIFAAVFGVYAVVHFIFGMDHAHSNTVAFLSIAFARLWHVFNMRDEDTTLRDNRIVKNSFVWCAITLCVALILFAVFVPGLCAFLGLQALPPAGWAIAVTASIIPFFAGQTLLWIRGYLKRKKKAG